MKSKNVKEDYEEEDLQKDKENRGIFRKENIIEYTCEQCDLDVSVLIYACSSDCFAHTRCLYTNIVTV